MDNEGVKEIADIARERELGCFGLVEPSVREKPIPLALVRDQNGGINVTGIKSLLDPWREFPERRAGTAKLLTLDSFVAFVNRHKDDGSVVFGDFSGAPKLIVVLDYHALDGAARHGKHRAEYAFPLSDEWKGWMAKNSTGDRPVKFDQHDFAMFLEDRVADLSSPLDQERTDYEPLFGTKFAAPSELLTLSRGLELNVSSKIKDVRNLQSGEVQLVFDEVHEDGKGKPLKVPGLFVAQIPLFVDGEKVRIIARLRYRKDGGSVSWFYQLYRPELIIRERLVADLAQVGEATGCPAFEGTPEA